MRGFLIVTMGAVLGCVDEPMDRGVWTPETAWRMEREWSIGGDDADGPDAFGSIAGIAVDAAGRVFVLDRQGQDVRLFAADGSWVRTFGREGGGPGEFTSANGIAIDPGTGHVWVVDGAAGRYTVFDSAGTLLATVRRPQSTISYGFTWEGRFTPDGMFWDYSSIQTAEGSRNAFLRLDSGQGFVDTLLVPAWEAPFLRLDRGNRSSFFFAIPFAPRPVFDISPTHEAWWARNDRYRLHAVDRLGDSIRTIGRPWEPIPIRAAERDSQVAPIRAAFRQAGADLDESVVPTHANAIWGFTFDTEGHLWVMPLGTPRYDVFDTDGQFLGTVPIEGHGWYAGRGTVVTRDDLTRVVPDQLGSPIVERWRIVRP